MLSGISFNYSSRIGTLLTLKHPGYWLEDGSSGCQRPVCDIPTYFVSLGVDQRYRVNVPVMLVAEYNPRKPTVNKVEKWPHFGTWSEVSKHINLLLFDLHKSGYLIPIVLSYLCSAFMVRVVGSTAFKFFSLKTIKKWAMTSGVNVIEPSPNVRIPLGCLLNATKCVFKILWRLAMMRVVAA